jgi:hypothetical protein
MRKEQKTLHGFKGFLAYWMREIEAPTELYKQYFFK